MRTSFPIVLAVLFLLLCLNSAQAIQPDSSEIRLASNWFDKHFADNRALPFSFLYDGKKSDDFLKTWSTQHTELAYKNRKQQTITLQDPQTGLIVRCTAVHYEDVPAVEWVVYFENPSDKETPILENIQVADFTTISQQSGDYILYHAEGSDQRVTDFQPLQKTIGPGSNVTLSSYGGRSSDGFLPFFNLAKPGRRGLALAIGWTGQWQISFTHEKNNSMHIVAGMEKTHLKLLPGETIRTPSILAVFWEKDRMRGQNLLRRVIRDYFSPAPGGKVVEPPIAASVHVMHGFDGQTTEQNMVDFVKTTTEHKLPVDYLWIDAGWYESTPPNQWVWTGTWIPDAKRFPNGLGPVGKAAHEHGLKFILWFEPERVMKNSWLHKNYPDWILAPSADIPDDQRYQLNDGFYLLNLGNPQALAWTKATFSNMIRDFGVDIYRQDFNIHPLPHWRNGEPEDRQGINEIKHIMGMYDFWDTLINQFPDILIDNCASGGRRLDLETTRRSLPLFRSDECWKPIPEQCMNMGLSLWLPYHGMGSISLDPYHFWSGIGTNFTVSLNNNDPSVWEPATKLLNQYRIIQTLLYGDFYPLTDYSLEENVWMVWQYHRDNSGQGLIMAFRRPKSEVDTMTFQLQGLSPQTKYSLTNMDSNETIILTGSDLMQKGLPLTVPSPAGVILLTYQKTE